VRHEKDILNIETRPKTYDHVFKHVRSKKMKPLRSMKVFLFSYLLFISGAISTSNVAYAQGSKLFSNPTIKGYRLDWCLHLGKQCGKPAANAWCAKKMGKADGYAKQWKKAVDIGASFPTYVIGDGKICDQRFCDGFQSITCGFSLD
jgi:hypothetical protein